MKNNTWEENPNWRDLEEPNQGDIIHLKLIDVFTYLVKVIVGSVKDGEVIGVVETVFDYDSEMPITGGDKLGFVNKEFVFKKKLIQEIIKKDRI